MFDRIKRKRERKNAIDGHEYEEYFLTEEQEEARRRLQEWFDAIVVAWQSFGVTVNEAATALFSLSSIFEPISEVDEKQIARDRSRADLADKRRQQRRGKNRHINPTGRK